MAPLSLVLTSNDMRTDIVPKSVAFTSGEQEENVSVDRRNFMKRKSSLKSLDMSSSSMDKSVTFSSVDIRDYSICPGDNPSVSRGIPLSLDWAYDPETSQDINQFEDDRVGSRREYDDLKLPSLQRVQMLKHNGFSRGEINERVKEVEQAKDDRVATRRKLEREDRVKTFKKSVLKAFGIRTSKSSPGHVARSSIECDSTFLCVEKAKLELEDETLTASISSNKSNNSEPCDVVHVRKL